jgi:3-hydroxymyristoyl/3-hydroxydecanoyl-(acyl carrier protein) dehydratase
MNEIAIVMAPDHPVFAGHFPGHPIVPGALLLAEALQALDRAGMATRGCEISSAKFLSPVGPGETVSLRWESAPGKPLRLELRVADRRVASAALVLREPRAERAE